MSFFFPKELELLGLLYGLFQQFISFDQRLVKSWFVYTLLWLYLGDAGQKWTFYLSLWFSVIVTHLVSIYNCNKGSEDFPEGAAERNFGFFDVCALQISQVHHILMMRNSRHESIVL